MASQSHTTTDHQTIEQWVEQRGGKPATVKDTADNGEAGILRIEFPGYGDEQSLEQTSWDEFWQKFDEANLAFLYQDATEDGEPSRFCRFIQRPGTSTEDDQQT